MSATHIPDDLRAHLQKACGDFEDQVFIMVAVSGLVNTRYLVQLMLNNLDELIRREELKQAQAKRKTTQWSIEQDGYET
jgi:hypothetical protein